LLSFGAVWAINKRLVGSGNRATATAVPSIRMRMVRH